MLITILILVCILIFLSLINLGETILMKKGMSMRGMSEISQLPRVTPGILQTMAGEMERLNKTEGENKIGKHWAEEFYMEQPCLAEFLERFAKNKPDPIVSSFMIYRLLKAQAEADSLADLTKIRG